MKTIMRFIGVSVLAGAGFGCSHAYDKKAEYHEWRAQRDIETGHPRKAAEHELKAEDAKDKEQTWRNREEAVTPR